MSASRKFIASANFLACRLRQKGGQYFFVVFFLTCCCEKQGNQTVVRLTRRNVVQLFPGPSEINARRPRTARWRACSPTLTMQLHQAAAELAFAHRQCDPI